MSIRTSSIAMSKNGCFHVHELPENQRFFKHANKDYLEWAKSVAFNGSTDPIVFELYSETLQKFRLAARGPWRNPAA